MEKLEVKKAVPVKENNSLIWLLCSYDDKSIFDKLMKQAIKGKRIFAQLKGEKRSNDANSYMWVLCDKIAKKLNQMEQFETKISIYTKAIEDIGVFEDVPIKDEAKERFIETWKEKGLGWLARELRKSKSTGYTVVRVFYGSSSYDSKEMSELIDYLTGMAQELNICTIPKEEIESLIREWNNEKTKT